MNALKITISLSAEPEDDIDVAQEAKTSGNPKGFKEAIAKVKRAALKLDPDSNWWWANVTVKAAIDVEYGNWLRTVTGEAHLGSCSYESAIDFIENSMYFKDMCQEAIEAAVAKIAEVKTEVKHGP